MGLLTGLLTLPLAPVKGVVWLAEQVQEAAAQEHDEQEDVPSRLAEIQAAHEAGQISTQQRAELEEQVLQELMWTEAEGN